MEIPYIVTPRKDTGLFNSKIAIWLFLASEVMLFGGFFSAYIFLRIDADYPWPERTLPVLPGLINTFVLIASSVTVVFAWASLKLRQWGKFQAYMLFTVFCSFVFMGLKGIEYYVKLHHQALRMPDYSVVEGHLGYKPKDGVHLGHDETLKDDQIARDVNGKKLEENLINFEASQITYNTVRYYKPWVEGVIVRAAEQFDTVVFEKTFVAGIEEAAATALESEIDNLKEGEADPAIPDAAKVFRKGDEITVDGLRRFIAEQEEAEVPALAREKKIAETLIAAAVNKPATVKLAADLKLQTAPGKEVVFAKGTDLSVKLLDDIKAAHLAARSNNSSHRIDSLREEWDKAHKENPGKKGWEIADKVKVNEEAIAKDIMPEAATVAFKVSPATVFHFRPRDIQEGAAAGTLRDATAVAGKMLESPMNFHYVDAIDFRHLAMKVSEKIGRHDEAAIEKAIEESWLLKENAKLREVWEKQQKALGQLTEFLATKGKVPTAKDKYRIGWQEMDYYMTTDLANVQIDPSKYAMPKSKENLKEEFFGPDYSTRKFPHLEVPRDKVQFSSKFEPAWNTYYAIYFTMTGLHGLHVIGGALVLAYYLFCGKSMYLSNPEWLANRVEVGGLFWHFVDLVWIFLFPILYLM
ncbi:cytochrome c oxidase subunit 3 [Luteolibacter flavescens]|uniref:Cytochrome c oxidase subunit 3 n=1 Tax=Luteolibacter flavescens TaxID=1859460 RepID=A0ABT3FPB3_9BACT|nr:cytochrome c oxidase subunit 3 [Luteolibacter flavescens]MCW1885416.1 cytochrome c oxidase subunit 3 [Luteolibacter flavescens]